MRLPGFGPFYDLRFGVGSDYPKANLADPGGPVFAAKVRMDAPYPDVQVVLPVRAEAVDAYLAGDRSVVAALAEELLAARARVLRELYPRGTAN